MRNGFSNMHNAEGIAILCMQPGVYDEEGLKRFDLTLARAAAWNIKIIYTFVNYWSDLGGMQW